VLPHVSGAWRVRNHSSTTTGYSDPNKLGRNTEIDFNFSIWICTVFRHGG